VNLKSPIKLTQLHQPCQDRVDSYQVFWVAHQSIHPLNELVSDWIMKNGPLKAYPNRGCRWDEVLLLLVSLSSYRSDHGVRIRQ